MSQPEPESGFTPRSSTLASSSLHASEVLLPAGCGGEVVRCQGELDSALDVIATAVCHRLERAVPTEIKSLGALS